MCISDGRIVNEGSYAELMKTGAFEQLIEECKNEQELFAQRQIVLEKEGWMNFYHVFRGCLKKWSNFRDFSMNFEPEKKFSSTNDPYRGSLMRGIDFAHFRALKMHPWSYVRLFSLQHTHLYPES